MITVIAGIIAILAGLTDLGREQAVKAKSASVSRAENEIRMLSTALESFKNDNGGYPQDSTKTDTLDPRRMRCDASFEMLLSGRSYAGGN